MAEAIARDDLSGGAPGNPADLVIFFNSAIDEACLGDGTGYYYGLDGNTPDSEVSFVTVATSLFAPGLDEAGLSGNLALVDDGTATPTLGCAAPTNAGKIDGRIAVIDRGECRFDEKSKFAQDAGAIAVIVINNIPGPPVPMGGDPAVGVTIPVVMVDMETGDAIKEELAS